jgi:hypothetical protein
MFKQPEVHEIEVSVAVDDLLGPLGYGKGGTVESSIMEQILSETGRCEQTIRGKAIHTCVGIKHAAGRDAIEVNGVTIEDETLVSSLDGAESLAVAVCTVGGGIDELIGEHFGRGDFLGGMIADIFASRAVEGVAEKCATLICAEARRHNLSASGHLSPGYGKWDVSGQRAVFALLDPSPIGVSLNEHCMMQPRKSVSFVIPLLKGELRPEERRHCRGCDFENCGYRRD